MDLKGFLSVNKQINIWINERFIDTSMWFDYKGGLLKSK